MSDQKELSKRKLLLFAALLSAIASVAYACPGHSISYSVCRPIALMGVPGILIAAAVSMALLGGAHGGGPLGMLLAIATPINFALYMGLGVAARAIWEILKRRSNKST